jgi:hypothetical protein
MKHPGRGSATTANTTSWLVVLLIIRLVVGVRAWAVVEMPPGRSALLTLVPEAGLLRSIGSGLWVCGGPLLEAFGLGLIAVVGFVVAGSVVVAVVMLTGVGVVVLLHCVAFAAITCLPGGEAMHHHRHHHRY